MAIYAESSSVSVQEITVQEPSPTSPKSASFLLNKITANSLSKSEKLDRPDIITKFTNCRLLRSTTSSNPNSQCPVTYSLVEEDLWTSSLSGTILDGQQVFYDLKSKPDVVIDCGGKIISPGFIDIQLNGGFGVNFSDVPEIDGLSEEDKEEEWKKGGEGMVQGGKGGRKFKESLEMVNRRLIPTGVTSYLPTLTSQKPEVYHKLLPHLGPSGSDRIPECGSESLGAHIEGPFLSPTKAGIHAPEVLQKAENGFSDLDKCYGNINGESNLKYAALVTAAPEQIGLQTIPEITKRGIVYSIGHTEATFEEASSAVSQGATMITHLFNAMRPLHHRNPGIFGVLGSTNVGKPTPPSSPRTSKGVDGNGGKAPLQGEEGVKRPYYGLIVDGIHLHPTSVKIAYSAHPSGCVLVTDAMHLVGLPDGLYRWGGASSKKIQKTGSRLTLEGEDTLAGSAAGLLECLNNFLNWTDAGVANSLGTATEAPARVLGIENRKGSLRRGADADLVVLEEVETERWTKLVVKEVWKFGVRVWPES